MPQHQHENHRSTKGPGKIIAVGGAKGGIGKSLFVANLGVLLSQLGKKNSAGGP
jgi:flagellar biosynthesis protein FlhG